MPFTENCVTPSRVQTLFDIRIHASQFPDQVQASLEQSLRERCINPKFHYESRRQARQWLALHEAYSPARTDSDVGRIYGQAFDLVASHLSDDPVHVMGLGCGGGQKEAEFIRYLDNAGKSVSFTAVDVSPSLVITSLRNVEPVLKARTSVASDPKPSGFVGDFGHAIDAFPSLADLCPPDAICVYTFFGMLPNFVPGTVLNRLAHLVRPDDVLLVSANLAPGEDYVSGVQQVLPQYDNPLTRDWLLTLLVDLGLNQADGFMEWQVEACPLDSGLRRVVAYYQFTRHSILRTDSADFPFEAGDRLRVFFSYRYTPRKLTEILARQGLNVEDQWISSSGEEGVFRVRKH